VNIKQIETFYWAARLGSFVQAAKRLNTTPSAVSMRIQEVEADLSVKLFDRSQRRALLTPEGTMMLPYAEEVLISVERMRAVVSSNEHMAAGYVRLGVTENVAITWLGEFMKRLKAGYPRIQIELEIGISHNLEEKLQMRTLDMAFAACELAPSHFESSRLQSIEFSWMCSPDLKGVPDLLTPNDLAELPVLSVTREWQARGALLQWFMSNRIRFRNVTICNTFRTCASMAIQGLGLAHLPTSLFQAELETNKLKRVPFALETPPLEILAIVPAGSNSPVFRAIRDVAQDVAVKY
jgi:DNA-binding transcriptional LysR family regulator